MSVLAFVALKLGAPAAELHIDAAQREMLGRQLRGKQVRARHNQRAYRVRGVAAAPADAAYFAGPAAERLSVADYFAKAYGVTLAMPHLPCLRVGREHDPVELPMELCSFLPGQPKRELTVELRSAVCRETCTPPDRRLEALGAVVGAMRADGTVARTFGVQPDGELTALRARVLEPLPLCYRDDAGRAAPVRPDALKGHWSMRRAGAWPPDLARLSIFGGFPSFSVSPRRNPAGHGRGACCFLGVARLSLGFPLG